MTNEKIKEAVLSIVDKYNITKVVLFGSRASKSNRKDSDVDLIINFSIPISLITLSMVKIELEEMLGVDVDIIHGPMTRDEMIEIGDEVVLYAA